MEDDVKIEGRSSRTPSESSEKGERPQSRDGQKYSQGSQGYSKSRSGLPPRFQKQHSGGDSSASRGPPSSQPLGQSPTSPQPMPSQMRPGQGPPPPWPFWGALPPQFMGYGPRPPMDMHGKTILPCS